MDLLLTLQNLLDVSLIFFLITQLPLSLSPLSTEARDKAGSLVIVKLKWIDWRR